MRSDPRASSSEPDCPYLTPHPHQAERNDPRFIPQIAEYLATYLALPVEEIDRMTDAAAIDLFGFGKSDAPSA
ncbi:MAG: TatD family hydrolase [Candidatus Eisenbacteria bacterium]